MDDFETLDAEADLEAFEVCEIMAKRQMLLPQWVKDGLFGGRLRLLRGRAHRILHRLAYRSRSHFCVVLRKTDSNEIIRLPFA